LRDLIQKGAVDAGKTGKVTLSQPRFGAPLLDVGPDLGQYCFLVDV
jgi:hypothetical protein